MTDLRCTLEDTPATRLVLAALDAEGAVAGDHWHAAGGKIAIVLTKGEIGRLESAGVPVQVGQGLALRSDRTDVGSPSPLLDLVTGFVSGYLDSAEVAAAISALAAAHPGRCTLTTLPFTTSGYDGGFAAAAGPNTVQLLRITTTPGSAAKPGFLLIGGTHAREWLNPLIAIEFAGRLLANHDPASVDPPTTAITALLEASDIFIIPVLNPDGLDYSIHDSAGWRKNRRPHASGCPGVDNNRNYEVYFGGAGSSGLPCEQTFRGPSAFSEAENLNVRHVLEQHPNILVGVDAHSFGEQILRPNPAGGSFVSSEPVSAADEAIYSSLETTLRSAIQAVNGNSYSLGTTSNHAGPSDEYLFFAHRVFGFNTECGTDFQPPWAQALAVIGEVVAGLLALATATVSLTPTTPTPLRVVQCLDRTGSMVAFGYESAARQNAKRFTDLLSLGDSTAVVSFADPAPGVTPVADRAVVEVPLTLLNDPGDAATVRAGIDAIGFGGWTPIGAGLLASAAQLVGSPAPRAVLLISDGYQNVDPTVATALAAWPALRVYTVALGPAADAVLLQSIATDTGGLFLPSPTALDLHQAYNDMRAGITDDGLVMNDMVAAEQAECEFDVEIGADRLLVTVSSPATKPGRLRLLAPSGRAVRSDDWGTSVVRGDGYVNLSVARPQPGRWRLLLPERRPPMVVAAFVHSPLRLDIDLPSLVKQGENATLTVSAHWEDRALAPLRCRVSSQAVGLTRLPDRVNPDEKQERLARWLKPAELERVQVWDDTSAVLPDGFSMVRARLRGSLPGGSPFARVLNRAVQVLT